MMVALTTNSETSTSNKVCCNDLQKNVSSIYAITSKRLVKLQLMLFKITYKTQSSSHYETNFLGCQICR